jgi:alkylation response protein AidB-like acyl-CoA dehydrogenase
MDFSLADHQLLIRDTVREFMAAEVRPHVKEWEKSEHFPLDIIKKLGTMGCCGMLMPDEWGGPGLDTISYVLMIEEVARVHAAISTALAVTNSAVQLPLLAFANEQQKNRYLRRLASGEIIEAFCLTDPAAGSDAAGIQARATRDGDNYKLSGTKTWVTNGSAAGIYIILPRPIPPQPGRESPPSSSNPRFPASRSAATKTKWASALLPPSKSFSTIALFPPPIVSVKKARASKSLSPHSTADASASLP